jgi:(S)-sulfolactate dehydrogenase
MTGLLMLLRAAYGATAAVAKGVWPRQALIGREIMGKTLGVVGFGDMAREVARRAGAFGMRVVAHDPDLSGADPAWGALGVSPRTLPELLAEADAVSLHLPLTEATHDLIDSVAIATMKRGAVLLNAARGGLVDETALAQALREGRLGGAMLDAYKKEPLPGANPFHDIPNLILTPRIAGVTEESNMRVGATVAEAVRRVLESGRTR